MVEAIQVRGAYQNNLRGVDLDLPLRKLIVFTGVSGSGKSSLAFDTLHQEGQRRYLEALSAQRGGQRSMRPAVDAIFGLPPTVALEQGPPSPDARETIGTWLETHDLLAVLFARAGTQHCGRCDAPIRPVTHDEIVGRLLALPPGTRLLLEAPVRTSRGSRVLAEVARAGFSRVSVDGQVRRLEEVSEAQAQAAQDLRVVVDRIRTGDDRRDRLYDAVRTTALAGRGVVMAVTEDEDLVFVDRPYCWRCDLDLPALEPRLFNFRSPAGRCPTCLGTGTLDGATCGDCGGTRLRPESLSVRFEGHDLPSLEALRTADLRPLLATVPRTAVTETALGELDSRLELIEHLGLAYLAPSRNLGTLSTGELQRVRLAAQVGARLSGVLYVLDEPTVGLHDQEVLAVIDLILRLRAAGNTVVVVEHHPLVVAAADEVVDFGPGAGADGGAILYAGPLDGLVEGPTATGRWLAGHEAIPPPERRDATGVVRLRGAQRGVLRDFDVDLPLGLLVSLYGPSASGKSTLLDLLQAHIEAALGGTVESLAPVAALEGVQAIERLVVVKGGAGRSTRSNPATYCKAWDILRELLAATTEAQVRGMDASFFSLNKKGGRCEVCKGTGLHKVDLGWLPEVYLPCEVCEGRRFAADVLEVRWKGHNAHELLSLRASDAYALLAGHPVLESRLRALIDVGLGYLPLGQPGHTLSGGEAQRLGLARELARANRTTGQGVLYMLDGPTAGLHPQDVGSLVALLRRLVHEGATVWAATHSRTFAEASDHVVTLGS